MQLTWHSELPGRNAFAQIVIQHDTLQRRRVTQFYAVQSNRNRGPMSIMATVPNLPKPSAPSASSDTVVDLCSTCFVCNQGIREATTEEDGEQALWCEGLHKQ